eukprot:6046520-Amphidinium_carterae.1
MPQNPITHAAVAALDAIPQFDAAASSDYVQEKLRENRNSTPSVPVQDTSMHQPMQQQMMPPAQSFSAPLIFSHI